MKIIYKFLFVFILSTSVVQAETHTPLANPLKFSNLDTNQGVVNSSPQAKLGRALFFDTTLSEPAGIGCVSCHSNPRNAWTDQNKSIPTSRGALGLFGSRNAPTPMYSQYSPALQYNQFDDSYVGGLFWDGRASSLEAQAGGPVLNHLEMNNSSIASFVAKIRTKYLAQFEFIYGTGALDDDQVAFNYFVKSIAAFERAPVFNLFTSKYDAYLAGKTALTATELRGLQAFESPTKGNCATCHTSRPAADGSPPLFTDFSYGNLGVPRNPNNPFYKEISINPQGAAWVDNGLGLTTNLASQDGKFKTPTLRNIAQTGPYMHNGYFDDLPTLISFLSTREVKQLCPSIFVTANDAVKKRCWPVPEVSRNLDSNVGRLGLTDQDINDITAFLNTLTDGFTK